jgi:alpha-tubulin suppressor-like RCC1 family protein
MLFKLTRILHKVNSTGQLGIGFLDNRTKKVPVRVEELKELCISISCGHAHVLALDNTNHCWSWGGSLYLCFVFLVRCEIFIIVYLFYF